MLITFIRKNFKKVLIVSYCFF